MNFSLWICFAQTWYCKSWRQILSGLDFKLMFHDQFIYHTGACKKIQFELCGKPFLLQNPQQLDISV